ncbi:MAG: OmpA family protein [Cytophagaceae bacterium]|nr:OmpA family protein [Cytophagaceae bacterium]
MQLNNILFERGTSTLTQDSYAELERLGKFLLENPKVEIELQGHTSNEGDATKNMELSAQRVKSVKNYLASKQINENRIKTKAFGSQNPIAPNDTEESKKKNRRVEFIILKK